MFTFLLDQRKKSCKTFMNYESLVLSTKITGKIQSNDLRCQRIDYIKL